MTFVELLDFSDAVSFSSLMLMNQTAYHRARKISFPSRIAGKTWQRYGVRCLKRREEAWPSSQLLISVKLIFRKLLGKKQSDVTHLHSTETLAMAAQVL
jgi:hypothetical protein